VSLRNFLVSSNCAPVGRKLSGIFWSPVVRYVSSPAQSIRPSCLLSLAFTCLFIADEPSTGTTRWCLPKLT